jgi:hypothetical protein
VIAIVPRPTSAPGIDRGGFGARGPRIAAPAAARRHPVAAYCCLAGAVWLAAAANTVSFALRHLSAERRAASIAAATPPAATGAAPSPATTYPDNGVPITVGCPAGAACFSLYAGPNAMVSTPISIPGAGVGGAGVIRNVVTLATPFGTSLSGAPAASATSNLSDPASTATARANLGLGSGTTSSVAGMVINPTLSTSPRRSACPRQRWSRNSTAAPARPRPGSRNDPPALHQLARADGLDRCATGARRHEA